MCRKAQNSVPDSMIEIGNVSTQAITRLRTVAHCKPGLVRHHGSGHA